MRAMLIWPAPAKLNLFLHVTGRRPDGYHELQTVFQFLDMGDELAFEVTEHPEIRRVTPIEAIPEDRDLTVRAARRLQERTGARQGVRIHLRKRLPLGGGLGGGSSDAATTLMALNRLWKTGLSGPELAALGLALGADVPVFIGGHAAWAEGVGEVLTPVDPPERWFVVMNPPVSVSTASVFADPELTRHTPPITIRAFREGLGHNDLEPVVRRLHPEVGAALDWLRERGSARLTGSGGCVFLPVTDAAAGQRVLEEAAPRWTGFVARGVNRHPITTSAWPQERESW
jgi:4-diphosphocytidyl-2-C-methyl-D-erythritol kinase